MWTLLFNTHRRRYIITSSGKWLVLIKKKSITWIKNHAPFTNID